MKLLNLWPQFICGSSHPPNISIRSIPMMTGIMSAVEAKNQSLLDELRAGLAKRSASRSPEQILRGSAVGVHDEA
jgi:hypothetical protein